MHHDDPSSTGHVRRYMRASGEAKEKSSDQIHFTNGTPKDSTNILVLKGNDVGEDFLAGDLHGAAELLDQIAKLGKDDRLILVGDLFDRGKGNFEIFDLIKEANKGLPPDKQKIYVTRGNHENLFLDYYNAFLNRQRDPRKFEEAKKYYIRNGGEWATVLESKAPEDEKYVKQIHEIAAYLKTLPYIIDVGDVKEHKKDGRSYEGFVTVHADLPIPYQVLQEKIKTGDLALGVDQKMHATWARPGLKDDYPIIDDRLFPKKRIYCGHSIGNGARIIRRTYNLDVGSYGSGEIVRVNHHKSQCEMFKGKADPEYRKSDDSMDPSVVKAQIEYFFKLEKTIGILNDYMVLLHEEKRSIIIEGKIAAIKKLMDLIDECEFNNVKPIDALRRLAVALDGDIGILTQRLTPPNSAHDVYNLLLSQTITSEIAKHEEKTLDEVKKEKKEKATVSDSEFEKFFALLRTKIVDFSDDIKFLQEFLKGIADIEISHASSDEKLKRMESYCIDTYCNILQSENKSHMPMAVILHDVIAKGANITLPLELSGAVYTGIMHSDYPSMNFQKACADIEVKLLKLAIKIPPTFLPIAERKYSKISDQELRAVYEARFMDLMNIAVDQWMKAKPSGMFSLRKGDPTKYDELNKLFDQYHVVINNNVKKPGVAKLNEVYRLVASDRLTS